MKKISLVGILFVAFCQKTIITMFQPKVFVPSEYIDQVLDVSKGVFNQNEEINFLKSCLYYLKEGMDANQAIDLAMIDYLVDM